MVTVPGAEQVTSPVEPIVAATVPVLVGEVFHERRPPAKVPDSCRLEISRRRVANLALRAARVVADCGLTVILVKFA